MIAIVAKMTVTSVLLGSTKAIPSIANPQMQFDKMRVFLRPQYFNKKMQVIVPGVMNKISQR